MKEPLNLPELTEHQLKNFRHFDTSKRLERLERLKKLEKVETKPEPTPEQPTERPMERPVEPASSYTQPTLDRNRKGIVQIDILFGDGMKLSYEVNQSSGMVLPLHDTKDTKHKSMLNEYSKKIKQLL